MRARQDILLAAVFALSAAACVAPYTPWPDESFGGLAEQRAPFDVELEDLKRRFLALRHAGAGERLPASMLEVQRLIVRAYRERAGGLPNDANHTIAEASDLLEGLEVKFGMPRSKPPAFARSGS